MDPWGAGGNSLTQDQRNRAEHNRLAALERRRLSAARCTPRLSQQQPQGQPQQAAPASSTLRGVFLPPGSTPCSALQPTSSGCGPPLKGHQPWNDGGAPAQRIPAPVIGGGSWGSGAGQFVGGGTGAPCALHFGEANQPPEQQQQPGFQAGSGGGMHPPQELTTHMHNWQQQQPAWPDAAQPGFHMQPHPNQSQPARGFRFSEPQPQLAAQGAAPAGTAFKARKLLQPAHPPLRPANWAQPMQESFAVKKVHSNEMGQPPSKWGSGGASTQQQLQQPVMLGVAPHKQQRQQQAQQAQQQEGRYGSNTTFTFTKGGPLLKQPAKQLTQATLAGTLSKWRAKQPAQQAEDQQATAASEPGSWQGKGSGPTPHHTPPSQAPSTGWQQRQSGADMQATNAPFDGLPQLPHWQQQQWGAAVGPAGVTGDEVDALFSDLSWMDDEDDTWGVPGHPQPSTASHSMAQPPQPHQPTLTPQVLTVAQQCADSQMWQSAWAPAGQQGAWAAQPMRAPAHPAAAHRGGLHHPIQVQPLASSTGTTSTSKWAAFAPSRGGPPTSTHRPAAAWGRGSAAASQLGVAPTPPMACSSGASFGAPATTPTPAPGFSQPQPPAAASSLSRESEPATGGYQTAAPTPPLAAAGFTPAHSTGGWTPSGSSNPPASSKAGAGPAASLGGWSAKPTPQLGASGLTREQRRAKAQDLLGRRAEDEAEDKERWGWLKDRRDADGRTPDDPAFDHTTILIPKTQCLRRPFDRQYWDIKRRHMDLVLFVRVGSFYELFDNDADIGIRVGLNTMSGAQLPNMWKVGVNHGSFNEWAARVLALGYNVGRVEEFKNSKNVDKLVDRRLVQVYTPGTVLDGPMLDGVGGSQPLIALFEGMNCMLAACVVDVSLSTISLSQWQEVDSSRSMLSTLLLHSNPAEVVVMRGGQLARDTLKLLKCHKPLSADGTDRMLTISQLHDYNLLYNPDCPESIAGLVQHTEDMYFHQNGKSAAWESVPEYLMGAPYAAVALQMAIHHLKAAEVVQRVVPHASLQPIAAFTSEGARASGHMLLDSCAIKTLELVEDSLGTFDGSLLRFLDQAVTAAGRRKVRAWLCSPLYRVADITERLDMVEAFMAFPDVTASFRAALRGPPDCERLLPKVADRLTAVLERAVAAVDAQEEREEQQGWGQPSGWIGGSAPPSGSPASSKWKPQPVVGAGQEALQEAFEQAASTMDLRQAAFLPVVQLFEGLGMMLQAVKALEESLASQRGTAAGLPPLTRALGRGGAVAVALQSLMAVFDAAHFSDPHADIAMDKGVCGGYDAAQAEVERLQQEVEGLVAAEQQALARQGEQAGVTRKVRLVEAGEETLLEVPISASKRMPGAYTLVKETKTVARFRVPSIAGVLAQLERARMEAKGHVLDSMAEAAKLFLDQYPFFLEFVGCMAALDALAGFAAATHPQAAPLGCSFCRPLFAASVSAAGAGAPAPPLHLEGLWNPQLLFSSASHIEPNTLEVGGARGSGTLLLTGANTGGKSTLLRATCLAVVMAQLGCYVPCSRAELACVDRIFTRIGAQDRIMSGESTFMVEMTETSSLLQHAQPASLVVLDELGRGTSTFDGYAIAYAVVMQLTQENRCRTLFATHYHDLNHEPRLQPLVRQAHMATAVQQDTFVPLFQLRDGPAPEGSCGIEVAAACGMPSTLIERALERAGQIEQEIMRKQGRVCTLGKRKSHPASPQKAPRHPAGFREAERAAAVQRILDALARDVAGELGALQDTLILATQVQAQLVLHS